MHLCVVQEERIELLDKLEQFPLKIRVKEEQESILRWAPFLHSQCLCPTSTIMVLHLCLPTGEHPPVGRLLCVFCSHYFCAHVNGDFKVLHFILGCILYRCICTCACQQVLRSLPGIAVMPFVFLLCPVDMSVDVTL